MQTSTWGGISVPSAPEAAAVPADLLKIVNQMSPMLVISVGSKAERDANLIGLPAGAIVTCAPAKSVWMSLGKIGGVQKWETLYANTDWISTGFVPDPLWANQEGSSPPRIRRKGDLINLRANLVWNGSSAINADGPSATHSGNIADATVLTIPNAYWPSETQYGTFRASFTSGFMLVNTSGQARITDMHTSSTIAVGEFIAFSMRWEAEES